MNIYLAGPDVFLPDAVAAGRRKVELCSRYGHSGLFPLDNEVAPSSHVSMQIYRGNQGMMDRADAVIANLTPFRGPSADAGTVFELGYMAGRGRLCLGYCNDPALYTERVGRMANIRAQTDGRLIDEHGLAVEDFGQHDNLMITHALELHGFPLVIPKTAPADLWYDLTSFEQCLRLLGQHRSDDRATRQNS